MRRLVNQVREYAWGSTTAIPRLLGQRPDGRPRAELWLGAHPGSPSALSLDDGSLLPLDAAIAADPGALLGRETVERFGERLPFLLKVLAAEAPLSLQVHPDLARARAGYAAEEAAGVPRDAAERNYKDPFHKPELVVALEPFEALCGFRDPAAVAADLRRCATPLAAALRRDLGHADASTALRRALTRILTLPEHDRRRLVDGTVAECRRHASRSGTPSSLATVVELAEHHPGDPGAVASLLLNRVTLAPGEALFLPAGNVHAYLRGVAVETMASSDNVLRAGLTSKHVDVAELLATVRFEALPVPYVPADGLQGWARYRPGVAEFALLRAEHAVTDAPLPGGVPTIVLALDGAARLRAGTGERLTLSKGESALIAASDGPVTVEGQAHLVAATVGAPGRDGSPAAAGGPG